YALFSYRETKRREAVAEGRRREAERKARATGEPNSTTVKPVDPIADDLARYAAELAERKKRSLAAQVAGSKRKRLDAAFHCVAHYDDSDRPAGEADDPTHLQFTRRWVRRWFHAARALRMYGDPNLVFDMSLPDKPGYVSARELFRQVW